MSGCEETRAQIAFYLDDELSEPEKGLVESHMRDCGSCREIYNKEQRLFTSIRVVRPLYVAPHTLRTSVQRILDEATERNPSKSPPGDPPGILWMISGTLRCLAQNRYVRVAFPVLMLAFVGMWVFRETIRFGGAPSEFARMAVDSHRRHLHGQLPLEIDTEAAAEISAWFRGKVPFSLKLPNYQEASGQAPLYRLEGARLVGFKGDYVAFVAYQMRAQPISLLVSSRMQAAPSGGEAIVLRDLVFYSQTIAGFKVISWSHRGLTYALVSSLQDRGQQSCLVCHQGTQDSHLIERLRPR